jgi:hypothetical protein
LQLKEPKVFNEEQAPTRIVVCPTNSLRPHFQLNVCRRIAGPTSAFQPSDPIGIFGQNGSAQFAALA